MNSSKDGSMHAIPLRTRAPHAASRPDSLTPTKPLSPTRGFPSVPSHAALSADDKVANVSGRPPNAAMHASTEAHFGHGFSRVRIYPDERADSRPGGEGSREPVVF